MWSRLKDLAVAPLCWMRNCWTRTRRGVDDIRPVVKIVRGARPRKDSPGNPGAESGAGSRSYPTTLDEVGISLSELTLFMRRWFTSDLPHEVSVVIPHAEVRIRKGRGTQETEIVLESITVVHSPRFPPKSGFRADGRGDEGLTSSHG